MSDGVMTPGIKGMFSFWQYSAVFSLSPGLTKNSAPAFLALSTCSGQSSVPAPTSIWGNFLLISLMASSAAGVRKVISARGSPPSVRACARGSASSTFSILTTGTSLAAASLSVILSIFSSINGSAPIWLKL